MIVKIYKTKTKLMQSQMPRIYFGKITLTPKHMPPFTAHKNEKKNVTFNTKETAKTKKTKQQIKKIR